MSQILVFKNSLLEKLHVKEGVTKFEDSPDLIGKILTNENLGYMERKFAEQDPNYRQVIPYCVLKKGDLYSIYERTKKGGENRLHSKCSIGYGGHSEAHLDGEDGVDAYQNAFIRELQEEVNLVGNYESRILGMIASNATEVDSVHFGVCYEINLLPNAKLEFLDPALDNGLFLCYDKLVQKMDSLESWSQLVVKHLLK